MSMSKRDEDVILEARLKELKQLFLSLGNRAVHVQNIFFLFHFVYK